VAQFKYLEMAVLDHIILIQLCFYFLHLPIEVHETAIFPVVLYVRVCRLVCDVGNYMD
jgi:hypothetical protein